MDKSGANYAGLANINLLLILAGFATMIDICQVKYLININPSFFHDLFKVAIRNAISDIKENRIKNNVFGKV
jgi:hypothetical protein